MLLTSSLKRDELIKKIKLNTYVSRKLKKSGVIIPFHEACVIHRNHMPENI
jgi:hypothetical protein